MGPNRDNVCVRAGRHLARYRLLFQGPDWRFPAACGHAVPPRDLPSALCDRSPPHLLSLKFFYRQIRLRQRQHSPSHPKSGNPTEPVRERIAAVATLQAQQLNRFPRRSAIREYSTDGHHYGDGFEESATAGYLAEVGPRLQEFFRGARAASPARQHDLVLPPY